MFVAKSQTTPITTTRYYYSNVVKKYSKNRPLLLFYIFQTDFKVATISAASLFYFLYGICMEPWKMSKPLDQGVKELTHDPNCCEYWCT